MQTWRLRAPGEWLGHPLGMCGIIVTVAAVVALGLRVGLAGSLALTTVIYGLPLLLLIVRYPILSIYLLVAVAFLANGVGRYVDAPWGLLVDALLVVGWLATLARRFPRNFDTAGDPRNWPELRRDGFVLSLLWFAYLLLEIANPEAESQEAWLYSMRAVGLYPVLAVGLGYFHLRERRHLRTLLWMVLGFSVLGALWGIRQKFFFLDGAERHWLFAEGHARQHVLFGVLRTFSFYSDAGQFGASQAMVLLMACIMAIRPPSEGARAFYLVTATLCLVGFGISGTRGALAVPAAGGMMYLLVSRNAQVFCLGALLMGGAYGLLRYTSVASGVEQVQRMRSALDPEEASLQVRLENQETLRYHLEGKPFGVGVGAAGFWGLRFTPDTIWANTPTDSYYVRLWVETGVVGLALHLFVLGYVLGAGAARVWHTADPVLRHERAALLCGYAGILLASYGNQVLSQFPTALIVYLAIPVLLSDRWSEEA